jgi:hypothetical protein
MGTNYYLHFNKCSKCGRYDKIHIGKCSAGWKFLFHYIERLAENVEQWRSFIKTGIIYDEAGNRVSESKFWKMVAQCQKLRSVALAKPCEYKYELLQWRFMLIDGYDFSKGEFC